MSPPSSAWNGRCTNRPETLSGDLSGLSKIRVGDYRILYEPDHNRKVLTVHLVGHRREIYS
ncbi:MAG: type II toxin-antitoxin system RelE/ParE family toxin [Betaproteobacteria bacterium]|nr:type II toxin-antitoxin system RelE/ParE family toxin [Betaproteobacteria bacterium]